MKHYELVIFDCDGVLIDSEPIANRVLAEQLSDAGLRLSVDEVTTRFLGRTRAGCLELARELLGHELPADFANAWDTALFRALSREVQPTAGVRDILSQLAVPFCVASNSTADRLRLSLEAAGLLASFRGRMFSADSVARPKPEPDLYQYAARSMAATPAGCVVIEDTPTGVQAGLAAGMTVLAYVPDAARADEMSLRGAIPFGAMAQLAELLPCRRPVP